MLLELAIFQKKKKKCKNHHDLNLKKLSIKQTFPFLQQNEKKETFKICAKKKKNKSIALCLP